jgi:hypothetical protein
LPNCAVAYPFILNTSARGAQVLGRIELTPGAEVAISVIVPIPTVCEFRPLNNAARVGAHIAVVWNRVYFKPCAASRSAVGMLTGPPNVDDAPKPTSSNSTITTFGAPAGGRSGTIGGYLVSGSDAS